VANRVAAAQVASFEPDLLFFTGYQELRSEWIKHLRETHPGVRLFGLWCGMPFRSIEIFKQFDLILTCAPELNERFRSFECNSRQVHHAFDPGVLAELDTDREQDISFSFMGQLIQGSGFHENVFGNSRASRMQWRSASFPRRMTSIARSSGAG
jgi:spore maturation protein CgeB